MDLVTGHTRHYAKLVAETYEKLQHDTSKRNGLFCAHCDKKVKRNKCRVVKGKPNNRNFITIIECNECAQMWDETPHCQINWENYLECGGLFPTQTHNRVG